MELIASHVPGHIRYALEIDRIRWGHQRYIEERLRTLPAPKEKGTSLNPVVSAPDLVPNSELMNLSGQNLSGSSKSSGSLPIPPEVGQPAVNTLPYFMDETLTNVHKNN